MIFGLKLGKNSKKSVRNKQAPAGIPTEACDEISLRKADFRLFDDIHFVDEVLATAEFLDDEQDVADIYGDTTLQVVVEVDVAVMSPLNDSQLPSKAQPMSSPLPFITGEPELPPVMSLVVRKQVGISPFGRA